eukprot:6455942-Amphidinium_carterae.1
MFFVHKEETNCEQQFKRTVEHIIAICFCLEENNWQLDGFIRGVLERYLASDMTTLLIENWFRKCKVEQKRAENNQLSASTIYHTCAYGPVLKEWGREIPEPTQEDRTQAEKDMPWDTEIPLSSTLPDGFYQDLSNKATWNTCTPGTYKHSCMYWQLLQSERTVEELKKGWLCRLLKPGMLAYSKLDPKRRLLLILSVAEKAFLAYRVNYKQSSQEVWPVPVERESMIVDTIVQPEDWMVAEVECLPPPLLASSLKADGARVLKRPSAHNLLKWNALKGFPEMSTALLQRLAVEMGIPKSKSRGAVLEIDLVTALLKKILNPCTPQHIKDALEHRNAVDLALATVEVEPPSDEPVPDDEPTGEEEEDEWADDPIVAEEWASLRQKHEAAAQRKFDNDEEFKKRWHEWVAQQLEHHAVTAPTISSQAAASTARKSTRKGESLRKYNPSEPNTWTQKQAAEYLPPGHY